MKMIELCPWQEHELKRVLHRSAETLRSAQEFSTGLSRNGAAGYTNTQ